MVRLLRNRDGIAIEKCPDALDEVQHATERELVVRNLDRDSNLLRNVRGALRLIAEGDFGVCVQCEEDVSPKRLAAVDVYKRQTYGRLIPASIRKASLLSRWDFRHR